MGRNKRLRAGSVFRCEAVVDGIETWPLHLSRGIGKAWGDGRCTRVASHLTAG